MYIDLKSPKMVENLLAHSKTDLTSKTITFYTQAGVADAGEAAGTIVFGFLVEAPILDLLGDRLGEYSGSVLSSSLVFTNGAMENGKEKGFIYNGSLNERFTRTVELLNKTSVPNGSWACDYLTGLFVVKKASTATSQTVSYKIRAPYGSSSGGSVTISDPVFISSAPTSIKGSVAVDTTAGGTTILPVDTNRKSGLIQNRGGVSIYVGTGTVTSADIEVAAGGDFAWESQEELKGLASSGSVNVSFIDYSN